jgi:hypothetical protein
MLCSPRELTPALLLQKLGLEFNVLWGWAPFLSLGEAVERTL